MNIGFNIKIRKWSYPKPTWGNWVLYASKIVGETIKEARASVTPGANLFHFMIEPEDIERFVRYGEAPWIEDVPEPGWSNTISASDSTSTSSQ
jgi:hypothetical protein